VIRHSKGECDKAPLSLLSFLTCHSASGIGQGVRLRTPHRMHNLFTSSALGPRAVADFRHRRSTHVFACVGCR
jgi:hypothetical protein